MKWYIKYRVVGFDKEFQAGPYEGRDVQAQADDISSYEGVYDVHTSQAVDAHGNEIGTGNTPEVDAHGNTISALGE